MIRKFEKNDIDVIMQIWKNENKKAHQFIASQYWEKNYNFVRKVLPNAEVYVYTQEEQIVGFIGLNGNYIEGLFVNTKQQGSGIGTALLNQAKETRNQLTLSVYQKNTNAIRFYQKNDFSIIKEQIDNNTNEMEYTMEWTKSRH